MILFFLLPLILLTIAAVNFVQIRTPKRTSELAVTVGVIVPMRNEAENVEGVVATLAAQEGSLHFYLLDDNSEDQTFELLQRLMIRQPCVDHVGLKSAELSLIAFLIATIQMH